MRLIRISTLALTAALLPLAACGQSEEERRREEAVDALADALGSREAAERIAAAGEDVARGTASQDEAVAQTLEAVMNAAGYAGGSAGGREARPSDLQAGGRTQEGQARLQAGFEPDPHMVSAHAGGATEVATQAGLGDCRGFAGRLPNYALDYSGDDAANLVVNFVSSGDATLTVRAPDGRWYCDDDSGGNLNPRLVFNGAPGGRYDIWVGNLDAGETLEGTLSFSGFDPVSSMIGGDPASAARRMIAAAVTGGAMTAEGVAAGTGLESVGNMLNPDAAALGGRHDFRGEARGLRMPVTYGGPVSLIAHTNFQCVGTYTTEPSVEIDYSGRNGDLFVSAQAPQDSTLAIRAPDGRWYCNDDAWSLNPGIRFADAEPGLYQVWMGSYATAFLAEGDVFASASGFGPQR
ncbi:hypothetical protein [Maricaulis sp.]|uniref:hypothetical protein n=1 Tax=Maricaulis sp. TaxID=1486257 RepID=UPI003297E453